MFDTQSHEFHSRRYAVYDELRAANPVIWEESLNSWLVTSYDAVTEGLRNPHLSVRRDNSALSKLPEDVQVELAPLKSFYSLWLMFSDPPQHTRVRGVVAQTLTSQRVRSMGPWLRDRVGTLLDAFSGNDHSDILKHFAQPLAVQVMARLLGVPEGEYEGIKGWSDQVVGFLGLARPHPDQGRLAQRSMVELTSYLREFIRRKLAGGDDLVADILGLMRRGAPVSDEEVIATCCNLLVDGHEPIASLICNGLLGLLTNPDQLAMLRRDESLLGGAIEEFLRYDSPFQYAARVAMDDVTLGGRVVRQRQRVMLVLGAANRDPDRFADPNSLDITRKDNRHCAFGLGTHFCPGAQLARAVGTVAFQGLLRSFSSIELLPGAVEWRKSLGYRGVERLDVRCART